MARTLISILIVVFCVGAIQGIPQGINSRRTLATLAVSDALENAQAEPEAAIAEVTQELKEEGLNDKAEIVARAADAAQKVTKVLAMEMSDNTAVAVADAVAKVLSEQAKSSVEGKNLDEEPSRRNLNSNRNTDLNENQSYRRYPTDKFILIPRQKQTDDFIEGLDEEEDDFADSGEGNDDLSVQDNYIDNDEEFDDEEDLDRRTIIKPRGGKRGREGEWERESRQGRQRSKNTNNNQNYNLNINKNRLFRRSFGGRNANLNSNLNSNINSNTNRHHKERRHRKPRYE